MKKFFIISFTALCFISFPSYAQLSSQIIVDKTGNYATVQFGDRQIQVKTVYPGHPGNGILLTPPVKPILDQNDNVDGFTYSEGMSASDGSVWIVEGTYTLDESGKKMMAFALVKIIGYWDKPVNLTGWISMFPHGTNTPPPDWYRLSKVIADQQSDYEIIL